jgi:hypothetical protein
MTDIPETYRRIREERVEGIVEKHMKVGGAISEWVFAAAFPDRPFLAVDRTHLHVFRDHRQASCDPLAFGETDIEVVGRLAGENGETPTVGLLIEMKVDSRQMEKQGLRYAARASYRRRQGSWSEVRCMLVAPRKYIENAYPFFDHRKDGWDAVLALEDVAAQLDHVSDGVEDAVVLRQSTAAANSWNTVIPKAAEFWADLARFQREVFPDVPIFINRQQGAGVFVWPSFFEDQLARNKREIRRKRIQIVHSGKSHVSLFVKSVKPDAFLPVVTPLINEPIQLGAAGQSWQSVKVLVPYVDPQKSLSAQIDEIKSVFEAARLLYDFFIKNERVLLEVTTFR